MATAKCNVSFQIHYTSSISTTGATALCKYRIKGSTGSYFQYPISPVPASGGLVTLSGIQTSGEYEYVIELTAGGVTAKQTGVFVVGECKAQTCEIPLINKIQVQENGQIVMDYVVNTTNLHTPEYQIATDADFKNIIHLKVGFDFDPLEFINMNDGNIPDDTFLYIRARKHCAPSGVSDWSNTVGFRSGKWVVVKDTYTFADAYCVSGKFKDPTNSEEVGASICWSTRDLLMKKINLTTSVPQVMVSYIYLSDGVTRAIPGNLKSFDEDGGTDTGFDLKGIRWVRFGSHNPSTIYDVDPSTGLLIGVSTFKCNS